MYRWPASTANWKKCTKDYHDDYDDDSKTLRGFYLRLLFCGINKQVTTNIIEYMNRVPICCQLHVAELRMLKINVRSDENK